MNIISWNICGCNVESQRVLYEHCRSFPPILLGIIEPKTSFGRVRASFWKSLNLVSIHQNSRQGRRSNIWVFAQRTAVVSVVLSTSQTVVIDATFQGQVCRCAFVHGSTSYIIRRDLWRDLLAVRTARMVIMGDFNAIKGNHEKTTRAPASPSACRDFCGFIDDSLMMEPPSSGLFYTWSGRRQFHLHVESVLDRVFISSEFSDLWSSCSYEILPRNTSDHSPLVLRCVTASSSAPRTFRFFSMWTLHPGFQEVVSASWSENMASTCSIYRVMAKLRRLKVRLKTWNREVFGMVDSETKKLQDSLLQVQQSIATGGYTDELFASEVSIQAAINEMLGRKNEMLRQQSRISWLSDGDRNTSFFHRMVKYRRSKHVISQLYIDGVVSYDPAAIGSHSVGFYTDLFSRVAEEPCLDIVDSLIPSLVSRAQAAMLVAIPDVVEIKAAIFSLSASSVPGPDGFGGSFYHACWDIIKVDLVAAIQTFFCRTYLPAGLNSNTIILLPKTDSARSISDFRPIVLSNFLFKIVSKILATRLGDVANMVIAPNQFGFVKGRQIHDCIVLGAEGVNCMERAGRGRGLNMACKVDISKAFDTMSWSFILRVLKVFGFPAQFRAWISCIFSSARLSIMVNGTLHGYFACTRGVRQGDPLSPILFGLAEDVLSRMLYSDVIEGRLQPMVYTKDKFFPSHLLYADDILLFAKASAANAEAISSTLQLYGSLSGQICNPAKSHVYFGKGVSSSLQRVINRKLGFRLGSVPFSYLGVPLFLGRPVYSHFAALKDRIISKFSSWAGVQLSIAGRVCLIRSVIQSSLIHSMLVYRWPVKLVKEIDRACRSFLWTGNISKKPFRPVSWETVCTPKEFGGLGLRSFAYSNDGLLAKVAWKVMQGKAFGYDLLQHKYLDGCRKPKSVRAGSSIWLSVRRALLQLQEDTFCSIGDGSSISFWWDDWLGYRLADRLNIPAYLRPFLSHTVSCFFFDGMWHFTPDFVANFEDVVYDILMLPLGDREDIRYWKASTTGVVTSNLVYMSRFRTRLKVKWGSWIWDKVIPVRRSILCWRAILGRLPTFDVLIRCGIFGPNVCMLCFQAPETLDHVLWSCSFANQVWLDLFSWFGVHELHSCADLNSFIVCAMECSLSPQFALLWKFGILTMLWAIWAARNSAIYEDLEANRRRLLLFVKASLLEASRVFKLGCCTNSWGDYLRSRSLGVRCNFPAPPSFVSVTWWPPPPGWIKVNTDGSALGCPGSLAAGGVFRDASGSVRGCFHMDGGIGFAYEAEILAAITAVRIAYAKDWRFLWLETDSTYVMQLLSSRSLEIPWTYANSWRQILDYIDDMDFRVSHIYREGNQVADLMANPDTPRGWWPYCIPLINDAVARDNYSPRFYRKT